MTEQQKSSDKPSHSSYNVDKFIQRFASVSNYKDKVYNKSDIENMLKTNDNEWFIYWTVYKLKTQNHLYEDHILFTNNGKLVRIQCRVNDDVKKELYCEYLTKLEFNISVPNEMGNFNDTTDDEGDPVYQTCKINTDGSKSYDKYNWRYFSLVKTKLTDWKKYMELRVNYEKVLAQRDLIAEESEGRKRKADELQSVIEKNKSFIEMGDKHRKLMSTKVNIELYENSLKIMQDQVNSITNNVDDDRSNE